MCQKFLSRAKAYGSLVPSEATKLKKAISGGRESKLDLIFFKFQKQPNELNYLKVNFIVIQISLLYLFSLFKKNYIDIINKFHNITLNKSYYFQ